MCLPDFTFILSDYLRALVYKCLQMNAHRHALLSDVLSGGSFHLHGKGAMKG